jgi:hypothetical protein
MATPSAGLQGSKFLSTKKKTKLKRKPLALPLIENTKRMGIENLEGRSRKTKSGLQGL